MVRVDEPSEFSPRVSCVVFRRCMFVYVCRPSGTGKYASLFCGGGRNQLLLRPKFNLPAVSQKSDSDGHRRASAVI